MSALRRHRRRLALVVWTAVFAGANALVFHQPWGAVAVVVGCCAALVGLGSLQARRRAV